MKIAEPGGAYRPAFLLLGSAGAGLGSRRRATRCNPCVHRVALPSTAAPYLGESGNSAGIAKPLNGALTNVKQGLEMGRGVELRGHNVRRFGCIVHGKTP